MSISPGGSPIEASDSESDPGETLREESGAARVEGLGLSEAVVRTIREPLLILDSDLVVQAANPSFYRTFHTEATDTVGRSLFRLGDGQWDLPELRRLLEDVLSHDSAVGDFEVEHDFPGMGWRSMILNARRLEREEADRELILLDLNLPRKDGREVLKEVKQDSDLKLIPVVVLTTSEAEQDVLEAYEYNANAYIVKPVDFEKFFRTIQALEDFWLTVVRLPKRG